MRLARWGAALVGLVVLQTAVSPLWRVWMVSPDWLLLSIILLAVYGEGDAVYYFAPALGYVRDVYSASVTGVSVLLFFLLAYLIRLERRELDFDSYLLDVVVAAGTLIDGIVVCYLNHVSAGRAPDWTFTFLLVSGRAAYNVLVAEAMRYLWKNLLESRLTMPEFPRRRRFREL